MQGYHDKYDFDKRTSRNQFYNNLRKRGNWKDAGEDEHVFYKDLEGDEEGIFGKVNYRNTNRHGGATQRKPIGWKIKMFGNVLNSFRDFLMIANLLTKSTLNKSRTSLKAL